MIGDSRDDPFRGRPDRDPFRGPKLASAQGRRRRGEAAAEPSPAPTVRQLLDSSQVQLLAMALAHLAHERPGWHYMTRTFADELLGAAVLFDRFYELRRLNLELPREGDSILDVRRRVEEVNPILWAMVSELCWPGGRGE